ncbi:MAG: hypothetical protein KDJ88_01580 [Bauldia sp.]|nr:hypothetical protein [Bauldia sp.]
MPRPMILALLGTTTLASAAAAASQLGMPLDNPSAFIPPQCYTRTLDASGTAHNPCFTCHVKGRSPNAINDRDLQLSYAFPGPALVNPWTNLFEDRSERIAAIGDDEILDYIRTDNYRAPDGTIRLEETLKNPPAGWDIDGDGEWSGYVPDAYFQFDAEGYDLDPAGERTGWRAFAYTPLPGSFSPASGSTDDVLIRLPEAYRQDADGNPDWQAYAVNLAIVEALIRRTDIPIDPVDEARYGIDLDKDGTLGTATRVTYDWAPLKGRDMSYVGRAAALQASGEAPLAAGLFPLGTEFVHSVRYVDVDDDGNVHLSPRLKELRYMAKTVWQTYADLEEGALAEVKEDYDYPDRLPIFDGNAETGLANGVGWRLQAFIEDRDGDLRPQSFEETVFCAGCHGGIGVTDDSTFAFARKIDTPDGGWFHWSQHGLAGIPDPVGSDGLGDYARYLAANGAGDEYRANDEVISAFFDADGNPDPQALERLRKDVSMLLYPSRRRALDLDKAYRTIVLDQDFTAGRAALLAPAENVRESVEQDEPTGIEDPLF